MHNNTAQRWKLVVSIIFSSYAKTSCTPCSFWQVPHKITNRLCSFPHNYRNLVCNIVWSLFQFDSVQTIMPYFTLVFQVHCIRRGKTFLHQSFELKRTSVCVIWKDVPSVLAQNGFSTPFLLCRCHLPPERCSTI